MKKACLRIDREMLFCVLLDLGPKGPSCGKKLAGGKSVQPLHVAEERGLPGGRLGCSRARGELTARQHRELGSFWNDGAGLAQLGRR